MVNEVLSKSYLHRAQIRFGLLKNYLDVNDFADVIREAQETVELLQKGILIKLGVQPPKWHDVSDIIVKNKGRLPQKWQKSVVVLRRGSKWLRSQREAAFYGDMDFIPEESYTRNDAQKAIAIAQKFLLLAQEVIK